jgi:hypothetical protein
VASFIHSNIFKHSASFILRRNNSLSCAHQEKYRTCSLFGFFPQCSLISQRLKINCAEAPITLKSKSCMSRLNPFSTFLQHFIIYVKNTFFEHPKFTTTQYFRVIGMEYHQHCAERRIFPQVGISVSNIYSVSFGFALQIGLKKFISHYQTILKTDGIHSHYVLRGCLPQRSTEHVQQKKRCKHYIVILNNGTKSDINHNFIRHIYDQKCIFRKFDFTTLQYFPAKIIKTIVIEP